MFISLADLAQFTSKLTSKRLANMLVIWWSYIRSRISTNSRIRGWPISISIEPTTGCNLACPECPSGLKSFSRPTGKLEQGLFKKIIDEVHEKLFYLIFYFQGEPYLHPDFLEMVSYASNRGIYTATSTNAHFLDDQNAMQTVASGLDRLIVSIDGSTQETYEAYRKTGSLDKVLDGTKRIVEWRRKLKSKTPAILWQFLVVRPNEHQISEIREMAKEFGVDRVVFKTAQIYDYENGNSLIPTIDKYSRYRDNGDGTFSLKNNLIDHCWKMWHSCVITWDGQMVPCCFDKDAEHPMGELKTSVFTEVWNSSEYQVFRKSLMNSRDTFQMCQNCTEGSKVWGRG
ncbi:MAG: radical SAM protein [Cytophagales bacterium]|nr:radical SAM protein [Cytophagales bacterium]